MILNPTLKHLTDVGLLEQLCSSSEDHELYVEFVNRFMKDANAHCSGICDNRNLDAHIGQQIAHETFEKVRKYKSFKVDEIRLADRRQAILVYLNRISLSLFNDLYNQSKKHETQHRTYFDDILGSIDVETSAIDLKNKKDIAIFIFNKLNKKEKAVVIADIEHKKFQKYLPDDITEQLALQLNVKKGTIRKIRERAIEKIKNVIKELNEN